MTAHAVANTRLVRDDGDRKRFLAQLQQVTQAHGWTCLAVCLLDTHYHLLITIPEANLGRGMQKLNGPFAQAFNLKYGRKGHLFRARYYSGAVTTAGHLLMTIRYIARNARDKGYHPAHYFWSSYPGVVGTQPCWPFVARAAILQLFGPADVAIRLLRDFVEDEGAAGGAEAAGGDRPP